MEIEERKKHILSNFGISDLQIDDVIKNEIFTIYTLDNLLYQDKFCPDCYEIVVNCHERDHFLGKCRCGWVGDIQELLNHEEVMNLRRNKLIDDIL